MHWAIDCAVWCDPIAPEMPVEVESRNYPPKAVKTAKDGKTVLTFLAKEMERMMPEPSMRSGRAGGCCSPTTSPIWNARRTRTR